MKHHPTTNVFFLLFLFVTSLPSNVFASPLPSPRECNDPVDICDHTKDICCPISGRLGELMKTHEAIRDFDSNSASILAVNLLDKADHQESSNGNDDDGVANSIPRHILSVLWNDEDDGKEGTVDRDAPAVARNTEIYFATRAKDIPEDENNDYEDLVALISTSETDEPQEPVQLIADDDHMSGTFANAAFARDSPTVTEDIAPRPIRPSPAAIPICHPHGEFPWPKIWGPGCK